jgi:hypothetical protein
LVDCDLAGGSGEAAENSLNKAISYKSTQQGLNVLSQEVVYIGPGGSALEGYGKDGKLKSAFHFPTTHATAAVVNLNTLNTSGAKAPFSDGVFIGAAEAVPFQNNRLSSKQRVETLQLKPELILLALLARLKPCPCYKSRFNGLFSEPAEAVPLLQNFRR